MSKQKCSPTYMKYGFIAIEHGGDGGWQVRDVDVEEKGRQDRSLWDAVLEASWQWETQKFLKGLTVRN